MHLPDDINISGEVKINGCKDLESMSNICIEGTGDFIVMSCEKLKHGPKEIKVAYVEFTRCKDLVGMGALSSKQFCCVLCPNLKGVDFTDAVEVSVGRECSGMEQRY